MRCRCGKTAVFQSKTYRIALCEDCYPKFYVNLVKRSINRHSILKKSERVLVCVSGGKDSTSMTYVLKELGYELSLLFIDLGIKDYSAKAKKVFDEISDTFDLSSNLIRAGDFGLSLDDIRMKKVCSACGTIKRYLMNKFARENGFDVLATGHTCDDIIIFFFKNVLSGNVEYITKLRPRLEGFNGLVTKVKPIFERSEQENLVLVNTLGLPFLEDRCPYKPNDTWRDLLQVLETEKPSFKQNFVRAIIRLADRIDVGCWDVRHCKICGEISNAEVCSFCRLIEKYSQTKKM